MSLWSCTACTKSFTRKGDLTRHQLLHTGVKPHVCQTCEKGFAQKSGLKAHLNVHTRAKPYICGIGTCKKAFGDPSSCARHRKEFHRRESGYRCTIVGCGTRIKRRSAFVAHLRKHGLDPNSFDIDANASQGSERVVPTQTHFPSANVESENHQVQTRNVSPSSHSESSGRYTPAGSDEGSHFMDEWLDNHPFDCRGINLALANSSFLPTLDQTMNVSLDIPHDVYSYLSSNLKDPFHFDDMFPAAVDCSLPSTFPLNLPEFDPFLETGIDGSQSSFSSPSSTYSTLY